MAGFSNYLQELESKDKFVLDVKSSFDAIMENLESLPSNLGKITGNLDNMIDFPDPAMLSAGGGGGGGDLLKDLVVPGSGLDGWETLQTSIIGSVMEPASTVVAPVASGLSWITKQVITVISELWSFFVGLAADAFAFLTSNFYWFLTEYYIYLIIGAVVAGLMAYLAFKVKRWWDGTAAVISKVDKSQKQIEKKIDDLYAKMEKLIKKENDKESEKIMKNIFKEMDRLADKNTGNIKKKLAKLPKDPRAVVLMSDAITSIKVNRKEVKKAVSKLKVA